MGGCMGAWGNGEWGEWVQWVHAGMGEWGDRCMGEWAHGGNGEWGDAWVCRCVNSRGCGDRRRV